MIPSFMQEMGNNRQRDDVSVVFDLLQENLSKYFDAVYSAVQHPRAMAIAIESILQNPALCEEKPIHVVLGRRGLSLLESYCLEAKGFFERGSTCVPKPLWRLEGDMLRRWGPGRRDPYTVHEAFWLVFLHRYVGSTDNNIEQLLFEAIKQTLAEKTTALQAITPDESLERFCARALRYVYTEVESHDFQQQMRDLTDEVFMLLT